MRIPNSAVSRFIGEGALALLGLACSHLVSPNIPQHYRGCLKSHHCIRRLNSYFVPGTEMFEKSASPLLRFVPPELVIRCSVGVSFFLGVVRSPVNNFSWRRSESCPFPRIPLSVISCHPRESLRSKSLAQLIWQDQANTRQLKPGGSIVTLFTIWAVHLFVSQVSGCLGIRHLFVHASSISNPSIPSLFRLAPGVSFLFLFSFLSRIQSVT